MISKEEILENIDAVREIVSSHGENDKLSDAELKWLARRLARTVNFARRKYKSEDIIWS